MKFIDVLIISTYGNEKKHPATQTIWFIFLYFYGFLIFGLVEFEPFIVCLHFDSCMIMNRQWQIIISLGIESNTIQNFNFTCVYVGLFTTHST